MQRGRHGVSMEGSSRTDMEVRCQCQNKVTGKVNGKKSAVGTDQNREHISSRKTERILEKEKV